MDQNTKGSGNRISNVDRVLRYCLTEQNLKGIILWVKNMGMGNSNGMICLLIKETFKMI